MEIEVKVKCPCGSWHEADFSGKHVGGLLVCRCYRMIAVERPEVRIIESEEDWIPEKEQYHGVASGYEGTLEGRMRTFGDMIREKLWIDKLFAWLEKKLSRMRDRKRER